MTDSQREQAVSFAELRRIETALPSVLLCIIDCEKRDYLGYHPAHLLLLLERERLSPSESLKALCAVVRGDSYLEEKLEQKLFEEAFVRLLRMSLWTAINKTEYELLGEARKAKDTDKERALCLGALLRRLGKNSENQHLLNYVVVMSRQERKYLSSYALEHLLHLIVDGPVSESLVLLFEAVSRFSGLSMCPNGVLSKLDERADKALNWFGHLREAQCELSRNLAPVLSYDVASSLLCSAVLRLKEGDRCTTAT